MTRAGGLRRAIFFDRDGVLVRARVEGGLPLAAREGEELQVEAGAAEACRALRAAGFVLVVVTNQPEIARGTLSREWVAEANARLQGELALDEVVVCPHDDTDRCTCRKPRPGMLVDAASRLGIDLAASYAVGDRWRDVEAGRRAGCITVLLDRQYSEKVATDPDVVVGDLRAAAAWILSASRP